ncbi:hypothetical protein F8G81_12440 [Arthrobacter sp. CDRTa11]|uniref:hypothetical protein n=1 Tax=Arthrobacter sp. CDRTa11 TaxID=2651199 RepID=UPI002265A20B|nr:hypothetical protein [Arthrobacter sp. CDRTa11]UZX03325.1 hypothetical protein F8G81_12440 [Arthrobacter sp. CDRTa11]
MRIWRTSIVPVLAALAVVLLGAAGAAGLDQMANSKTQNSALFAVQASADGQPSLHRLVMIGLAEGSLPGGFPSDEAREEKYDENFQETLHVPTAPA